jgi:hypothetical protein
LAAYPLDDLTGLVDSDNELSVDQGIFVEGSGSLLIQAEQRRVVRLFEILDPNIDAAMLVYSAQLKSSGLVGRGYLEMWCRFPGDDEYFSRGLDSNVGRVRDWLESSTRFRLEKGQMPDRIRLNLVLEGGGMVWVDNVQLRAEPLPEVNR